MIPSKPKAQPARKNANTQQMIVIVHRPDNWRIRWAKKTCGTVGSSLYNREKNEHALGQ
jgi:hypothetical protein